jgi:hypothetical protein
MQAAGGRTEENKEVRPLSTPACFHRIGMGIHNSSVMPCSCSTKGPPFFDLSPMVVHYFTHQSFAFQPIVPQVVGIQPWS